MRKTWMMYRLDKVLGATFEHHRQKSGKYKRVQTGFADTMQTDEVLKALKLSNVTIRRWLANEYFLENDIAIQAPNGRWEWDRKKLIIWVIAAMKLKIPKETVYAEPSAARPRYENPMRPNINVESTVVLDTFVDARRYLGMPEDYVFQQ